MSAPVTRVKCPGCGKRYGWAPAYAGKKVRCTQCRGEFRMPTELPAAKPKATAKVQPAQPRATSSIIEPLEDDRSGSIIESDDAPVLTPDDAPVLTPDDDAGPVNLMDVVDMQPAPAPAQPQARACPNCRAPVGQGALLCTNCGYNIQAGKKVAKTKVRAPGADTDITLGSILRAPFGGNVPAEAIVIVGVMFLASLGIAALAGIMVYIIRALPQGTPQLAGLCVAIGILLFCLVRLYAWLASRYMGIAHQYATGGSMPDNGRSLWLNFGMFLIVSLIGWGPYAVGLVIGLLAAGLIGAAGSEAGGVGLLIVIGLITLVWGWLYWPMGVAMAGARGTLNPTQVVGCIFRAFPAYLMVLLMLIPLLAFAIGAGFLVAYLLVTTVGPQIAGPIGALVIQVLIQYAIVSQFAMLGQLLRRYT